MSKSFYPSHHAIMECYYAMVCPVVYIKLFHFFILIECCLLIFILARINSRNLFLFSCASFFIIFRLLSKSLSSPGIFHRLESPKICIILSQL